MHRTTRTAKAATVLIGILLMSLPVAAAAEGASPDDTARVLAGMEVASGSPLQRFTDNRSWQWHAKRFNSSWNRIEKRQLSKIRRWRNQYLPQRESVVFYMFSGPDFLYANAFFPDASTYVLSGLEPVGPVPRIDEMSERQLARELRELQGSLNTVLSYSFFITKKMRRQLRGGRLTGTVPILYVFLARSGKTLREVSLVRLDSDGDLHPADEDVEGHTDQGVKIVFSDSNGSPQTLYYFTTDVSNGGTKKTGFLKFCDKLGRGDSLLKSASYLMHSDYFSDVRDFVLEHSVAVVQDDSGIPIRHFDEEQWEFLPFGNYLGPISIFPGRYQRQLKRLFRANKVGPLKFGIGYRWRPRQSNLLLAVKKSAKTAQGETPKED